MGVLRLVPHPGPTAADGTSPGKPANRPSLGHAGAVAASMGDVEWIIDAYLDAWNTPDASDRWAKLPAVVTEDVVLVSSAGVSRGPNELAQLMEFGHDAFPGATFERVGGTVRSDGQVEFCWQLHQRDASVLANGTDIVEVADDGRLARIVVTGAAAVPQACGGPACPEPRSARRWRRSTGIGRNRRR